MIKASADDENVVLLFLAGMSAALADDWPQWLGAERDGIWREAGVRKDLPEEGAKVLWRAPVSWGYAGPAVAERKGLCARFCDHGWRVRRDDRRGASQKVWRRILCLDAETGKQLWKHEVRSDLYCILSGRPRA